MVDSATGKMNKRKWYFKVQDCIHQSDEICIISLERSGGDDRINFLASQWFTDSSTIL